MRISLGMSYIHGSRLYNYLIYDEEFCFFYLAVSCRRCAA